MNIIYYIETNLTCIIILCLLGDFSLKKTKQQSSLNLVFNRIIAATIVFCVSELIAAVFRGQTFAGANAILSISNWLYFEALAVISFLWVIYVEISTNGKGYAGKRKFYLSIPLAIYTAAALSNFATGFLFVIDQNGLYVRGSGVFFHWVITWGYFLFGTFRAVYAYAKEKSKLRRSRIKPLILFFIAPMIAAFIQMVFYGVTTTQVGITISLIMIYISTQNSSVLTDPLTGLNNRRGLFNYLDRYIENSSSRPIILSMIDVDGFKEINDRCGHIVGDQVLQGIAEALKSVCEKSTGNIFLCRYGGDEFLIASLDAAESQIPVLNRTIVESVAAISNNYPCPIGVSIGSAFGACETPDELTALLDSADKSMYEEKAKNKSKRAG